MDHVLSCEMVIEESSSQAASEQANDEEATESKPLDEFRASLLRFLGIIADEPGDSEDVTNIESLLRDYQDIYEALWNDPQCSITDITGIDEQFWQRLTHVSNFIVRVRNRQNLTEEWRDILDHVERMVLQPLSDRVLNQHAYRYSAIMQHPDGGSPRIRVLHLMSAPREALRCRIEHTTIASTPYIALSYEWGSPSMLFWIDVIQEVGTTPQAIPLTANLYCALCGLRDSADISLKTFWIDQICIDQVNEIEKSQQVQLMGRIYAAATQVVSYLGPGEYSDREACKLLDRITEQYGHLYTRPLLHSELSATHSQYIFHEKIPKDLLFQYEAPDAAWSGLARLLYGSWTRRLWMVVETCVNANADDLLFLRGVRTITFADLAAIQILSHIKILPQFDKWGDKDKLVVVMLCWDIRSRKRGYGAGYIPSLARLLTLLSTTAECSDPSDRVYALLGLAQDAESLGITVDYSQNYESLLHDTTIRIMSQTQGDYVLEPLHHWSIGNIGNSQRRIPSWVSRWNSLGSHTSMPKFYAMGLSVGSVRFSKDLMQMHVPGIQVSVVEQMCCSFSKGLSFICSKSEIEEGELGFVQAMAYDKDKRPGAVLVSSIMASQDWPFPDCDQDRAVRALIGLMKDNSLLPQDEAKSLFEMQEDLEEEVRNPVKYILSENCVQGRSLCRLDEGRICLAPCHTQTGDLIVLFRGGETAFVLRPHGTEYLYVGDAYVHGLMNAEMMQKHRLEDLMQEFVLV